MHFQYVVAPPSVALPPPPAAAADGQAALLRELIDVQREQLAYLRAAHESQNANARWQAFLSRYADEFPGLGKGCQEAFPHVERAFLRLLDDLSRRLTDEGADPIDDEFSFVLTTGRRLEFYNTGVQTRAYPSARRQEEVLWIHPDDAATYDIARGDLVRVRSRRGELVLPAGFDTGLSRGLLFMTLHFPDQTPTNVLTIEATDPIAGTAEFKAAAVSIDRVRAAEVHTNGQVQAVPVG